MLARWRNTPCSPPGTSSMHCRQQIEGMCGLYSSRRIPCAESSRAVDGAGLDLGEECDEDSDEFMVGGVVELGPLSRVTEV